MDKKWIICIIVTVIIGLIIGIGLAIYSSSNNDTENIDLLTQKELAESEENGTNTLVYIDINALETSVNDSQISPNAVVIRKTYYGACDHLIRVTEVIPEELVNKNEEGVQVFYPDWTLEEYSPTQIILYKAEAGNCGEHYFIQEHNGVIGIYTTNEDGVRTLQEDTEISTKYLPEEDILDLQEGVEIIGKTNLFEFLENYE